MIIKFPSKEEMDDVELRYSSYTDNEGDLGVSSLGRELSICRLNDDDFLVGTQLMNREALAEFLWVAAIFVDSEKRYYPEVDLVGCDY